MQEGFRNATLDPANPTVSWRTLQIDTPERPAIEALWRQVHPEDRDLLRAVHGIKPDEMHLTQAGIDRINGAFQRNLPVMQAIEHARSRVEPVPHFDPHFPGTNILAHYASSLQRTRPGGNDTTLTISQLQRSLPQEGHILSSNVNRWVDVVLQRAIRQAVEEGATSITLPSAETVFRYNNPGAGMESLTNLYNNVAPRRMRELLREIDPAYRGRGERVDRLYLYEDYLTEYKPPGAGAHQEDRGRLHRPHGLGRITEDVNNGFHGSWTRFDLTPAVIRHHQAGRGTRLLEGGVLLPPLPQDQQDGTPTVQ
jgi:hypothetical protein